MATMTQMELFSEMDGWLTKIDYTTWRKVREAWAATVVAKKILTDLIGTRQAVDEQLTLLESEVPESSCRIAAIRAIIGPLAIAAICFGMGALGLSAGKGEIELRRTPTTVRVASGRRIEEAV